MASDTSVLEAAPHDVVAEAPRSMCGTNARARRHPCVSSRSSWGRPRSRGGVRRRGVIRREDVERFAAQRPDQAGASIPTSATVPTDTEPAVAERETRLPIRGVRKATASAMVRSAFTAPHVTCFLEVDVTETARLVANLRADARLADHRIGILAVVAKAVCLALRAEPSLNSRWDDEAGEIVQYHYVNLGIAAATERGLIVPHIPDAHTLGLAALADAIRELTQTARAGRAAPPPWRGHVLDHELRDVRGRRRHPILNPPEAGSSASARCAAVRGSTRVRSRCARS
jgi:pyruvate dehydrogenase E2 component (dihydrolipoamide acetyltransferase)